MLLSVLQQLAPLLLQLHVTAQHACVFTPSPLHAASIWGRSRFSRTWRQISIRPPQLNSSGSISKAAESQPFIALSAIQYHKVRSFGAGNLTALNSSKTELQWRAHNIMSLTREAQREAARSCGAQTPPSSLAWQRGVSLKCVCVCVSQLRANTPVWLPGPMVSTRRASQRFLCLLPFFLSSFGFFVIHSSASLLSCFCVCFQSDQCHSALVGVVQVVAPCCHLFFYTWNPFSFISAAAEIFVCFWDHKQANQDVASSSSSSEMLILLFELRTMTALTDDLRRQHTCLKLHPGPFSFWLLCPSQQCIKLKPRLPCNDCSLVNTQPVLCRKAFFFFTETLNKVIFVITKPALAQIMVSDSLFSQDTEFLLSMSDSISKSAAFNWKLLTLTLF